MHADKKKEGLATEGTMKNIEQRGFCRSGLLWVPRSGTPGRADRRNGLEYQTVAPRRYTKTFPALEKGKT